jgi:outer membrane protein
MQNILKLVIFFLIFFLPIEKKLSASDIYFIDYSKVMNESTAGKKAQDYLKNLLKNSNKKFNETAKKLKSEENKIISQKNALSKEEYKKKADALRKKVFDLNKEREKSIKEVATKRKKAGDEMLKNLNPILGKYMEENNISVVIDKKNVLMGNKKFEITTQIIEILNKEFKSINLN